MAPSNNAEKHVKDLRLQEQYIARPTYDYGKWLNPETKEDNYYKNIIKNREKLHQDAKEKFENVEKKLIDLYQKTPEDNWSRIDEIAKDVFAKRQLAFNKADYYSEQIDYVNELFSLDGKSKVVNKASQKMRDIRIGISPKTPDSTIIPSVKEDMRVSLESVRLNEKNLQHFLATGTKLDNSALEDEQYLRRGLASNAIARNVGETAGNVANAIFSTPQAGAYSFGKGMTNVMSKISTDYDAKKANRLHYDLKEVSENSRFQEAEKKTNKLFAQYGSDINFVNPKYVDNLKSSKQTISDNLSDHNLSTAEKNYLSQLIKVIDQNIDLAEKRSSEREKYFQDGNPDKKEVGMEGLEEKFKEDIQNIVDSKNDALKWNLPSMFVMASPFRQAVPVVGALFQYMDVLGHIMGPIFTGDGGFSQGFASVLTDQRVFGPLAKLNELIRLDDGVELFFDKTPIIQEFFGKEGVIDALTRNGIFDVMMTEFSPVLSSSLAYMAVGGIYGAYRGTDYINREYGEDTKNSEKSAKTIKDAYIKDVEAILKKHAELSKDDVKSFAKEREKEFFNLNKKYYREGAIIDGLVDLINDKNADPRIIKIFDDLQFGGKDSKKNLKDIVKNNQISKEDLEELYYGSDDSVKSEAILRVAILLKKIKENSTPDIDSIANLASPKNANRPTVEKACANIDADYCDICFDRFHLYDQNQVIEKYRNGESSSLAEAEERIVFAMNEKSKYNSSDLPLYSLENKPSSLLRKPSSVEALRSSNKEAFLGA